jgi:tetratricopeptide (TPR) repeat protein
MTALATLLYLDSRYFSSLDSERWLASLAGLSETHAMRNDDKAALGLFLNCLAGGWCDMSGETYRDMLLTLVRRYPADPVYLDLLARYFAQVEQNYAQAIHYHQELLANHPGYLEAIVGLAAWHNQIGDRDQMLEYLGILLRSDSSPAQVQRVKNMFVSERG